MIHLIFGQINYTLTITINGYIFFCSMLKYVTILVAIWFFTTSIIVIYSTSIVDNAI